MASGAWPMSTPSHGSSAPGSSSVENWLFTVRGLADDDVMLLKANGGEFHTVSCGGESCESLTDETLDMFRAMADDTVSDFLLGHPQFINK